MPVTIKGSGGGSVTLDAGTAAADTTLTLPNTSGTILQSGTAVTVAQGGTGAATLAANNVLLGNGTSALQVVAPGTSGNVLTSNGTTWTSAASGSGTVTSVATGTGLTGGTITTSGTISLVITFGAVGTYAFLANSAGLLTSISAGSTYAGSALYASGLSFVGCTTWSVYLSGGAQSGTWRAMGTIGSGSGYYPTTLFVRIA